MKKLYIFDFDGTLVNTLYDSVVAYNKALEMHGLPQFEYEDKDNIDFEKFIGQMSSDEEILKTYKEIYTNSPNEDTLPYKGIREMLKKLDEEEDTTLAICSNRIQQLLDMLTEKLFPDIDFKYVIGHEIDGKYKPDPSMLKKILDHEDFENNEIVYIGDRTTDIITAKNSNIDAIIVTWGQGNKEAYEDNYPIKVVDNPMEILDI